MMQRVADYYCRAAMFTLIAFAWMAAAFAAEDAPKQKDGAAPWVKRGVPEMVRIIDDEIGRHLREAKLPAGARSADAKFMRRVYLDVTGRIPTATQAAQFLDSKDPGKRGKLIDELLASPRYGEQLGRFWRDWIAPAELPSDGNAGVQPIEATQNLGKWLGQRFNAGDGWDKIVRAILTVDGKVSKEKPQVIFFALVGDDKGIPKPAGAARAVGSLFMGVQIQCAQCHNDPFKEWKQADFWGTAAFFRNTTGNLGAVTESLNGVAKVKKTEAKKGEAKKDEVKKEPPVPEIAPTAVIAIPKEAFKNAGKLIPAKFLQEADFKPQPKQMLRSVFADWLTARENPYFARAFVNRTWAYYFARGIVHPLDDFRDDNPSSHPALLRHLTDEFIASDFDVKHLIRCITNSQAYQRSSQPTGGDAKGKNAMIAAAFGRMPVKVMSADMLYDSLSLAFSDTSLDLRMYDAKEVAGLGMSSPVGSAYDEFVILFGANKDDATDFTHGIPQMLALINHPRLRSGGKTVDSLLKAKLSTEQAVETLYLTTLSRRPTAPELDDAKQFIAHSKDERRGYNGLLWTLVNRSEFLLVR
jgi:hypothetical protein